MGAPDSGASHADEGFWVAVLPFKCAGSNADLTVLAEGLSEEIVTGLSRFSYLRVIARSSTSRYAGQAIDVRTVGTEIGARYVMEGSLRQVGTQLRVAVQLVDAATVAHLWAETYERPFRAEDMFALQDDLVPRIVSTVADMQGVLPRSMSDAVRSRPPEELSPYEAGSGPSPKASEPAVAIAVLPFSDMSPARDQEYLCEGMAEEIMNALVRVPGMRVASRTSGSRLRVTAQLTDAESGYQLWSERYDRELADIFALQDDIAAGVVEAVKARLVPGAGAVKAHPPWSTWRPTSTT